MTNRLLETKSLLAKLMATENITVEHANVPSAGFNLKTRVLQCPIWKDMDGDLYDLLMGHEVSHALNTPPEGWHDAVVTNPRGSKFKDFLNVVEDARIEKMIKRKYPGIRKAFSTAYHQLLDRDFFGIAALKSDYTKLNLIDRINLYEKCGATLIIKFSDEEREYLKMVDACETWQDVVAAAEKIWDYIKQNEQDKINNQEQLKDLVEEIKEQMKNKKKNQKSEKSDDQDDDQESNQNSSSDLDDDGEDESDDFDDDSDGESDDESESTGDSDDESENESEKSGSKSKSDSKNESGEDESEDDSNSFATDADDASDEKQSGKTTKTESSDRGVGQEDAISSGSSNGASTGGSVKEHQQSDPESITDRAFRQKENTLVDVKGRPHAYIEIPFCDLKKTIVPNKLIVDYFEKEIQRQMSEYLMYNQAQITTPKIMNYDQISYTMMSDFIRRNNKYISLLVKEFEMRKNATQYLRQLESKSGELDTRRLARYKFSNDIFRKITEAPKGKNHGMIMFVDMSGSMNDKIRGTIEQVLVLTIFCKKVGLPFEVYGFSDNPMRYGIHDFTDHKKFVQKTPNSFGLAGASAFHLKELISSDLSPRQFKRAANMLLMFGTLHNYDSRWNGEENLKKILGDFRVGGDFGKLHLNGTPFIETLVASKYVINNFKNKTHADIINVVYLTDGVGAFSIKPPNNNLNIFSDQVRVGLVDPDTKKKVMLDDTYGYQRALTQLIRDCTGCRHIGFYVGSPGEIHGCKNGIVMAEKIKNNYFASVALGEKLSKQMREDGFFNHPNLGYDNYYYMVANNSAIEDPEFEVRSNANKDQIKSAFVKNQNKKHNNRSMVTTFAKEIAA